VRNKALGEEIELLGVMGCGAKAHVRGEREGLEEERMGGAGLMLC